MEQLREEERSRIMELKNENLICETPFPFTFSITDSQGEKG